MTFKVINEVADRPASSELSISTILDAAILAAEDMLAKILDETTPQPDLNNAIKLWPSIAAQLSATLDKIGFPNTAVAMKAADQKVKKAMAEIAQHLGTAAIVQTALRNDVALRLCKSAIKDYEPPTKTEKVAPSPSTAAASSPSPQPQAAATPPAMAAASAAVTQAPASTPAQSSQTPTTAATDPAPATTAKPRNKRGSSLKLVDPAKEEAEMKESVVVRAADTTTDGTWPNLVTVRKQAASDVFFPKASVPQEVRTRFSFPFPTFEFDGPLPEVPQHDEHYTWNARALYPILRGLINGEHLWIHGHTGAGKSSIIEQIADRANWPYFPVSMEDGVTASSFYGKVSLVPGPDGKTITKFVEGILPTAMRVGGIIVLEEISTAPPDVLFLFQAVLDGRPLRLLEDGGRLVKPHPYFRIVATDNTKGRGDPQQIYPNCKEQSLASINRWTFVDHPYAPPKQNAEYLMRANPTAPRDIVDKLTKVTELAQQAFVTGESPDIVTMRDLKKIVREFVALEGFITDQNARLAECLKRYLLARLDEQGQANIKAHVRSVFAINLDS